MIYSNTQAAIGTKMTQLPTSMLPTEQDLAFMEWKKGNVGTSPIPLDLLTTDYDEEGDPMGPAPWGIPESVVWGDKQYESDLAGNVFITDQWGRKWSKEVITDARRIAVTGRGQDAPKGIDSTKALIGVGIAAAVLFFLK